MHLPDLDYETVMQTKTEAAKELFATRERIVSGR